MTLHSSTYSKPLLASGRSVSNEFRYTNGVVANPKAARVKAWQKKKARREGKRAEAVEAREIIEDALDEKRQTNEISNDGYNVKPKPSMCAIAHITVSVPGVIVMTWTRF